MKLMTRMLQSLTIISLSFLTNVYAQQQNPRMWDFPHFTALKFNGATNLEIKNSPDNKIHLQILNAPDTSLDAAESGNMLALRIQPATGSTTILSLPSTTRNLYLENVQSASGDIRKALNFLSLEQSRHVNFQGQEWMLQKLYVNHSNDIKLKGIATPYLVASVKKSQQLTVQGKMALRELMAEQSKNVEFYWIDSPILTVNSFDSNVLLSGSATVVNLKAEGTEGKLDAKYLTGKRLFVKALGKTNAEVTSTDTLNALAGGESNVYYYHQPALLNRYYRDHGSVLYMGDAPPPCTLPYCPVLPRILPG